MTSAMVVGVTIGQALSGEWENPVPSKLWQAIQGADHAARPAIQDMGIDHGGTHAGMPQQFLHRANVLTRFQQVGGKGMAERVGAGGLGDPRR